ncbi:MAG: acyl-ACP--UDP-N-acetylglucosamine O-acyltransferase [Hyphomicrobiales bacterium]|nr:acyl-ACP--UDP-N-acetylglucosamine O-acyltransferase [Hyphomicrobiales bacterium]MDE2016550.1 acyl-ACP--UDP-N-acetylglucosamine O-acyltransferase [Hyphomicrobiales bacterium]
MARIHPSAIVEEGAVLDPSAEIGPFCLVGAGAKVGPGATLVSHVAIEGDVTLAAGVRIEAFCKVGGAPQSLSYKGEPTRVEIGEATHLREGVTVSRGTAGGGGLTRIGARCHLFAASHVGHDCALGDDVILTNGALLAGHCEIGDGVIFGGAAMALQRTRIGRGAFVSGLAGVTRDVIPFGLVIGAPAELAGLNVVGLTRRGLDRAALGRLRAAYRAIFFGPAGSTLADRLDGAQARHGADPLAAEMFAFVRAGGDRPLCTPRAGRGVDA